MYSSERPHIPRRQNRLGPQFGSDSTLGHIQCEAQQNLKFGCNKYNLKYTIYIHAFVYYHVKLPLKM